MTSEVAVMNRLAVALAADSALSVSSGKRKKVYNSANKLFMLSQSHPVGVMVYDSGSLMGVPWETLIKTFRHSLGNEDLPRLEDYGDRLIAYIEAKTDLFTKDCSQRAFLRMAEGEFGRLAQEIRAALVQAEAEAEAGSDWPSQKAEIVAHLIHESHTAWGERAAHPLIPAGTGNALRSACSGEFSNLVTRVFRWKDWTAASQDTQLINELAEFYVDKDYIAQSSFSGLVIAGFGRDDFFPVLQRFRIGDIYGSRLKFSALEPVRITDEKPVYVQSYADSDMTGVFLKGISRPAFNFVAQEMFDHARELVDIALEEAGVEASDEVMQAIETRRNALLIGSVGKLNDEFGKHGDVEESLVHIPKDELANVASSLVNLNSFKKRISMNVETVGGPVDVAVISKGDGFVWIERKHYFDADKNPHFVRRQTAMSDSQEQQ
jgi:hypothetical protein